ncbi:hypothetical protein SAMN02744783_04771 [Serratia sp. CC22-02]|uniref:hypothetical protein n=1 Tax=Serratia sp. CC22-02 TaxID=1378076 RepID=UPI0024035F57|nr:hypothetical protein [Serratia sp. CC22-02]SMP80977.1 hypothetical protein SAMN02744783_04771 [Serratia sp. CC22-02]
MVLPICVTTLSGPNAQMLRAIYKDNVLVMGSAIKYPPNLSDINSQLVPALLGYVNKGMVSLVDEVSGDVSKATGANRVRLSDKHTNGHPVISVALDRYNELKRTNAIITPKDGGSRFDIPPSIIDVSYNSNGEPVYNIAWAELRPEHILTILCCYGTFYQPVGSAGYFKRMMSALYPDRKDATQIPAWITTAAIESHEPTASLAGDKADDEGTVFL